MTLATRVWGNEIAIIENDGVISDEKILAEKFNNHHANVVERSCGVRPTKLNLVNYSFKWKWICNRCYHMSFS